MAKRTNLQIRRDINRLNTTIQRHTEISSLAAIAKDVSDSASKVNSTYRNYQLLIVQGNSERTTRDAIVLEVSKWIQEWRPVILLKIHGAQDSIRALPNSGVTPDDIVNVAKDLVELIKIHPEAKGFSEDALKNEEAIILEADTRTSNASSLLTQEKDALKSFSAACTESNTVLVRGSEIVRTVFGKTSPEYKKLISKSSSSNSEDDTNNGTKTDDTTKVDNAPEVKPVVG